MPDASIVYDHINKRMLAILGEEKFSVPVRVVGTKHAAISASAIREKTGGRIGAEPFVKALKRYRNRGGKSFIVELEA